jgi:hypothetical protein
MIVPAVVTILLNGSLVTSVVPARIAGGRVVVPLTPVAIRLAARVAYDPLSETVTFEAGGRRIVVPVAFIADDVPFVAVGPVVTGLGGSLAFDTPTKTLAIALASSDPIATAPPFDRSLRRVDPRTVFTPAPTSAPARPRAVESGLPRPRRTAIPVTPSEPVIAPPPATQPTNRRRR